MTRRKFAASILINRFLVAAIQRAFAKVITLKEFVSVKDFGMVGDSVAD